MLKRFILSVLTCIDLWRSRLFIELERRFRRNCLCLIRAATITISPQGKISFIPYTARVLYVFRAKKSFGFRSSAVMDPVNLVFAGANSKKIRQVLEQNGWNAGSGGAQYMCIEGKIVFPLLQMEFASPRDPDERFHVRLYDAHVGNLDWVVAASHHEYYDHHEENHIIHSWEHAEKLVATAFLGFPQTTSDLLNSVNYHGKPSDGKATIIDLRGSSGIPQKTEQKQ